MPCSRSSGRQEACLWVNRTSSMRSRQILITGGTGFIGGKLLERLVETETRDLVLLVRPGTAPSRYAQFERAGVKILQAVMHDPEEIEHLFDAHAFDVVYHIAAIRGARSMSRAEYLSTNVDATEQIARQVSRTGGRLVFCSSVGVFGTVPQELPASERTPRHGDTLYHRTKIAAEARLRAMVDTGLNVVIIRPTVTYGTGDDGFPVSLIRLVDSGRFVHCSRDIEIHLGDVQVLTQALIRAAGADTPSGTAYVVADREPVRLRALVDLINYRLRDRPYPRWKALPGAAFDLAAFASDRLIKSEAWKVRFQLISKSWYYDTVTTQRDLGIELADTLQRFGPLVDWYLHLRRK